MPSIALCRPTAWNRMGLRRDLRTYTSRNSTARTNAMSRISLRLRRAEVTGSLGDHTAWRSGGAAVTAPLSIASSPTSAVMIEHPVEHVFDVVRVGARALLSSAGSCAWMLLALWLLRLGRRPGGHRRRGGPAWPLRRAAAGVRRLQPRERISGLASRGFRGRRRAALPSSAAPELPGGGAGVGAATTIRRQRLDQECAASAATWRIQLRVTAPGRAASGASRRSRGRTRPRLRPRASPTAPGRPTPPSARARRGA